MKKTIAILSLIILFALGINAQEAVKKTLPQEPAEASKKTLTQEATKPVAQTQKSAKQTQFKADVTGQVISLTKLAMGGIPTVTKAEAEELVKKGQPLALKSNDQIYLVYNTKNAFDGKSLAKYAEVKNLGIAGEVRYINGFAVIFAKQIQPVE
jgi:hypothetical protein